MLATRVAQILFFADGKQVCNVLDPIAAECEWDAGAEVRPHVFRVVANLIGGGRIIASSRTKGLDQAEKVSVDVVQVTAVVTDHNRFVSGLQQVGVQAVRRRRAADDRPLLRRRLAARDRGRHRRQREHDAGDAAAEERGEEIPGGARPEGSGDARGVQRQHVHAHQARNQRRAAHPRRRSPDARGAAPRSTT